MIAIANLRIVSGLTAKNKFRFGILRILPSSGAESQRKRDASTFNVYNKSSNIRTVRYRDPWLTDLCTEEQMRPRLPESIQPIEMRYPMDAPPWPYKEKSYWWYHRFVDHTTKRFDENTKLICVEGNIGSGKSKFCQDLAKMLDFQFVPAPKIDEVLLTNAYGMDMRKFYHLFPERYQIFDEEMFYTAPKHKNVNFFGYMQYALKFEAYCNALAHILNTGQGVVIEQSPFTNLAYVEAMYNKDFLTDYFADWYPKMTTFTQSEISLFPHLYIYLDVPVSKCLENIKKRGIAHECNGKVIDYEYLSDIEKHMKNFLKDEQKNAEVLMFDWTVPGNMDFVANDIYKIDFSYDRYLGNKFDSWNCAGLEWAWNEMRQKYTGKRNAMYHFSWFWWEVPEFVSDKEEKQQMRYVLDNIVGKYCNGFNTNRGDSLKNILFPQNYGSLSGNDQWTEWTLRDDLWAVLPESWIYTEKPLLPNLTEEHFAPRQFNLADLAHAHH